MGFGVLGFGVVGFWGFGVLGFWGFGVLGFWGFGVVGLWGFGVLGFWGFGVLGFWGFGVLGFWGFGVLGFGFRAQGLGFAATELSANSDPLGRCLSGASLDLLLKKRLRKGLLSSGREV